MVSKASEDLPEPDRPVNTTSLSRGISTSMFLRLCSRAPRIVIARRCDPAFCCWRFALITSSIPVVPQGIPKARDRANKEGALRPEPGSAPMGMSANVGRTGTDFQWTLRIVNGLLSLWRHLAAGLLAELHRNVPPNKKAGARPAFRDDVTSVAKISTSR